MAIDPSAAAPPPPVEREHAEKLGLWGWICLLTRAVGITVVLAAKIAKAALGGSRHGQSLYKYAVGRGMRDYQAGFDVVGMQNVLPSTQGVCVRVARRLGLPHATLNVGAGASAVRLGSATPTRAVLLLHGGGYAVAAVSEHVRFACGFETTLPSDLAVYVLQYALASESANHYPRQLEQAVAMLDYLLRVEQLSPAALTLVGDSAGGHLLASLLLHLAHPHPRVPPLDLDGRRLAGAAFVSPWIIHAGFDNTYSADNVDRDVLRRGALDYWAANFRGTAPPDAWSCPLTAPADWWADLPVDDVLVLYGEDEILRALIVRFAAALQARPRAAAAAAADDDDAPPARTTTVLGFAGEFHDHMIVNRYLRINEPCRSEQAYRAWLRARVGLDTAASASD